MFAFCPMISVNDRVIINLSNSNSEDVPSVSTIVKECILLLWIVEACLTLPRHMEIVHPTSLLDSLSLNLLFILLLPTGSQLNHIVGSRSHMDRAAATSVNQLSSRQT